MSKTSCAARCSIRSVQGMLRAPAEGEGGLARREDLTAAAAATLERSAGTVAHGTRAARERRRRRAKVSRGRRAGGARPARRGRSSRVPRDSNERWGAHGRRPLERRRDDDFYLGLGFPTQWTGSVFLAKVCGLFRAREKRSSLLRGAGGRERGEPPGAAPTHDPAARPPLAAAWARRAAV